MKPILFNYAYSQKEDDFRMVVYDYDLDLNKIDGKTVKDRAQFDSTYVTKTKVQRESDDDSNQLLAAVTKTDVQREVDDESSNALIANVTKTNERRESDDAPMDSLMMLLTKTEQQRESDE